MSSEVGPSERAWKIVGPCKPLQFPHVQLTSCWTFEARGQASRCALLIYIYEGRAREHMPLALFVSWQVNLTEGEIRGLCIRSREIFMSQPVLLEVRERGGVECRSRDACNGVGEFAAGWWRPRIAHALQ